MNDSNLFSFFGIPFPLFDPLLELAKIILDQLIELCYCCVADAPLGHHLPRDIVLV